MSNLKPILWAAAVVFCFVGFFSNPAAASPNFGLQVVTAQQAVPKAPISDSRPLSYHQVIWERGATDSWQRWWALNREPYLQIQKAARRPNSKTPGNELLPGMWRAAAEDVEAPTRAQMEYLIRPSLQRLRSHSTNRDVHAEVMTALARVGLFPRETGNHLRLYLASPSLDLAQTAAISLGVLEDGSAWEELQALVADDSHGRWMSNRPNGVPEQVRIYACYGIGLAAPGFSVDQKKAASDLLLQILHDPKELQDLQAAAVIALGMLEVEQPAELTQQLLGVLHDSDVAVEIRAHCPTSIAHLLAVLPRTNPLRAEMRSNLAHVLKSRTDAVVRQSCLQALGVLSDGVWEFAQDDADLLTGFAESGRTPMERNFAYISLAYLGANTGYNTLVRDNVVKTLLHQMQDASPSHRSWAALSLGLLAARSVAWTGPTRVQMDEALLLQFSKSGNPEERAACAIALGLSGQMQAKGMLKKACEESKHPMLRGHLAVALGMLQDSSSEELLLQQLAASKHLPSLLERTAIGLALMGSEKSVPALLKEIDPGKGYTPTLGSLSAAARGLGLIGNARTTPHLITAMDNMRLTPTSRAYAAQALGLIADKDPLPWQYRISRDINYLAGNPGLIDWADGNGVLDRR
jgi:HEAT repeat protein